MLGSKLRVEIYLVHFVRGISYCFPVFHFFAFPFPFYFLSLPWALLSPLLSTVNYACSNQRWHISLFFQYLYLLPSPHSFSASYIICPPEPPPCAAVATFHRALSLQCYIFYCCKKKEMTRKEEINNTMNKWGFFCFVLFSVLRSPDFSQKLGKQILTGTGIAYSVCKVNRVRYFSKILSSKTMKRHNGSLQFVEWNPEWLTAFRRSSLTLHIRDQFDKVKTKWKHGAKKIKRPVSDMAPISIRLHYAEGARSVSRKAETTAFLPWCKQGKWSQTESWLGCDRSILCTELWLQTIEKFFVYTS